MANKDDIIKRTSRDLGLKIKDVGPIFDRIIENILKELDTGEPVQVRGFGTFSPKELTGRRYKLPGSDVAHKADPRSSIKFVASKGARDRAKDNLLTVHDTVEAWKD
jgi:nucleoid DNA-binding protein